MPTESRENDRDADRCAHGTKGWKMARLAIRIGGEDFDRMTKEATESLVRIRQEGRDVALLFGQCSLVPVRERQGEEMEWFLQMRSPENDMILGRCRVYFNGLPPGLPPQWDDRDSWELEARILESCIFPYPVLANPFRRGGAIEWLDVGIEYSDTGVPVAPFPYSMKLTVEYPKRFHTRTREQQREAGEDWGPFFVKEG